jgi:hypothetical protein
MCYNAKLFIEYFDDACTNNCCPRNWIIYRKKKL